MRSRLGLILILSALVVGGLGVTAWWLGSTRREVLTDDGLIEQPVGDARPRDILWLPPEPVDRVALPPDATGGSFSLSGQRFAYAAEGPQGDLDLFEATLSGDRWTTRRLVLTSSRDQDATPAYSPDGQWLWFASDRVGGEGGFDLWRAPALDDGWGPASRVELGGLIQTEADELSPAWSPDGAVLALARRPNGHAPSDLVLIDLTHEPSPVQIPHELGSEHDDRAPAFSPAGDFFYFASDRPGGAGGLDLYRSRVVRGLPGDALWLGEEVNSDADETDPALTMSGFRLLFRSTNHDTPGYHETTSREVFRSVRTRWPGLGIGRELLGLLPWLLIAIALVMLFAGLRRFASPGAWQRRWGTLGLMARCALVSVALHAMLAILFTLWRVQATLPGLEGRDTNRVTLTSSAAAQEAADQVLASSTKGRAIPSQPSQRPAAVPADSTPQQTLATHKASAMPTPDPVQEASSVAVSSAAVEAAVTTIPIERPTLPAGTQARTTEARSESVSLPQQQSAIDVTPAETSPTRLATDTRAPDRAHGAGRIEAPIPKPHEARHEPSPPTDTQASTVPRLPARARSDADERVSRQTNPADAAPRPTHATAAQPRPPIALAPAARRDAPAHAEPGRDAPSQPSPDPSAQPAMSLTLAVPRALPVESAARPTAERDPSPVSTASTPAPTNRAVRTQPIHESRVVATQTGPLGVRPSPVGPSTRLPESAATTVRIELPVLPVRALDAGAPHDDATTASPRRARAISDAPRTDAPTASAIALAIESTERRAISASVADADAPLRRAAQQPARSAPDTSVPMLPMARVILGIVLDNQTQAPIADAMVRLDGEGDLIRMTTTGEDGRFTLTPPTLPDFAALAASADGFVPTAVNIASADVGEGIWIELRLDPTSRFDIALDPQARVHHLGNDEFTGRVNSQFQRDSEGVLYTARVELDAEQLASPTNAAELRVFVKGAQNANPITVNGRTLRQTLTDSPDDGSFEEIVARIPLRWLVVGQNTISIRATKRQGTDIDDFEFVNPRLVLKQRGRGTGGPL